MLLDEISNLNIIRTSRQDHSHQPKYSLLNFIKHSLSLFLSYSLLLNIILFYRCLQIDFISFTKETSVLLLLVLLSLRLTLHFRYLSPLGCTNAQLGSSGKPAYCCHRIFLLCVIFTCYANARLPSPFFFTCLIHSCAIKFLSLYSHLNHVSVFFNFLYCKVLYN